MNYLASEGLEARLMLSVTGYEKNKDKLSGLPYIRRGEIAITVQMCIGEKKDGKYLSCIPVTEKMLGEWEVSKEDLFEKASENSKKMMPGMVKPLKEFAEMTEDFLYPDGNAVPDAFILTNAMHFNGAAALFYHADILTDLGKQINKNDFALLPTGQNEMICIAVDSKDLLREYQVLFEEFSREQPEGECIAKNIVCLDIHKRIIEQMDGVSYPMDLDSKRVNEKICTMRSNAR